MEFNKKLNIKFLREMKFIIHLFSSCRNYTYIFKIIYFYNNSIGFTWCFHLILEAFEKGIKITQLKSKGAEVKIEMVEAEAKEKIKEKAESLTNSLKYKVNISKEKLDKDEMKEIIQRILMRRSFGG